MDYLSQKTKLLPEPSPAEVDEIIEDRIRIRWRATYWDAYVYIPGIGDRPIDVSPGQSVSVIGIRGTRLIVLL